jgi:hypothetical protein
MCLLNTIQGSPHVVIGHPPAATAQALSRELLGETFMTAVVDWSVSSALIENKSPILC